MEYEYNSEDEQIVIYTEYDTDKDIQYFESVLEELNEVCEEYGFFEPLQRMSSYDMWSFLESGEVPEYLLDFVKDDKEDEEDILNYL